MEWHWNYRMMEEWEVSRNPVFSSPKKTPAFLLIPSFLCHFKMSRMTRNENNNGEISFQCHSTHFDFISSFKNDDGMTKWGEMKGYFWTKAKPLILKLTSFHSHSVIILSFLCHSIILMAFHHSYVILSFLAHSVIILSFFCHSIIPMSFHHSYVIPSFLCHSIIPMSFYHSYVIPSFLAHSVIILSFLCHSSHFNVIQVILKSFCYS